MNEFVIKGMMTKKPRARREKNLPNHINKISYIRLSGDDVWNLLDTGANFLPSIPFYSNSEDDKLWMNVDENEEIHLCGGMFNNYAITNKGRVWSFKTKKFIKVFYRPTSVIAYMNSTSNVKLLRLFEDAGWVYNHNDVCEFLTKINLLVNDYK